MNMEPRDEFKQNDNFEMNMKPKQNESFYEMNMTPNPKFIKKDIQYTMNMEPKPEFKSNEMYGMNMTPKGTNTTNDDNYALNMDPIYNNYKEETEERDTGLSR